MSQRIYGLVLLSTVLDVPTVASHLADNTNLPGFATSCCSEVHLTVRCVECPAPGNFSCDPDGVLDGPGLTHHTQPECLNRVLSGTAWYPFCTSLQFPGHSLSPEVAAFLSSTALRPALGFCHRRYLLPTLDPCQSCSSTRNTLRFVACPLQHTVPSGPSADPATLSFSHLSDSVTASPTLKR